MEDTIALTSVDLGILTNANFPIASETEFVSTGGIDVTITPVSKGADYRELRKYHSDEEDSEYHLSLRYSRTS
jgi:hypothetical protein